MMKIYFRKDNGNFDGFPNGGANISFESENYQAGCLQTTPKIFRFSNNKYNRQKNAKQMPSNIPMGSRCKEENINNPHPSTHRIQLQDEKFAKENQNILQNHRQNNFATNDAFIHDIEGNQFGSDQLEQENHLVEYENQLKLSRQSGSIKSDDEQYKSSQRENFEYFTKEVDVDEDINYAENENDLLEEFGQQPQQQHSFISSKMKSNFQNHNQQKKHKSPTKSKLFSFNKTSKRGKNSKYEDSLRDERIVGQDNPIAVNDDDDHQFPSVILTPPTPSPKMSTSSPSIPVEKLTPKILIQREPSIKRGLESNSKSKGRKRTPNPYKKVQKPKSKNSPKNHQNSKLPGKTKKLEKCFFLNFSLF